MSGIHKELTRLSRLAEEQGWRVENSGNHLKWYRPGDAPLVDGSPFYTTSKTPSTGDIINTIKSDLKRNGMVLSRTEWKRLEKEKKRKQGIELEPDLTPQALRNQLRAEVSRRGTDYEIQVALAEAGLDMSHLDEGQISLLCTLMRSNFDTQECRCGNVYDDPILLAFHCAVKSKKEDGHWPADQVEEDGIVIEPEPSTLPPDSTDQPLPASETAGGTTHPALETPARDDIKSPHLSSFVVVTLQAGVDLQLELETWLDHGFVPAGDLIPSVKHSIGDIERVVEWTLMMKKVEWPTQ